jgi:hypothetical protein
MQGPRLVVARINGTVTWSEIWMFQIPLSPCAGKSANSFGITDTPQRPAHNTGVADRAEFADRRVALRRRAAHLGVEIGLTAAADYDDTR